MGIREWQQLNEQCAVALEKFVQEAKKTSGLLASIKQYPAPFQDRKKILNQRSIENSAYNAYLQLRFQLCRRAAPAITPDLGK
jgi:hypothetical protein